MSIKVGVYDFFAHLIGGSFLFAALLYIFHGLFPFPVPAELSSFQIIALGAFSYIMGYAATPISSRLWYRFFAPKDLHQQTIKKLNKEIPNMKVDFDVMDWYTLLAFIKKTNKDMGDEIEQYNAISIMLRTVSFSLVIFSAVFGVQFFSENLLWTYLVFSILCLIFAIIFVRASVTYHTYFFRSIYQTIVAILATPGQLSVKLMDDGFGKDRN